MWNDVVYCTRRFIEEIIRSRDENVGVIRWVMDAMGEKKL